MTDLPFPVGRVGRARSGRYKGMFIEVTTWEGPGWILWLHDDHPRNGPTSGWDSWCEDSDAVLEWLGPGELNVEWID